MPSSVETATGRGRRAESLAETYLLQEGYSIVTRNHRCAGGEIDLIAWDNAILCFIEVRARSSDAFGDPLETIDQPKIRRIARAARHYLESYEGAWPEMRFDALGILLTQPPSFTLIKAAFEA